MTAAALVARALRNPGDPFPTSCGIAADELIACAARHRTLVLLGSLLRASGTLHSWPPSFVDAFLAGRRDAVAVDCIRHAELTRVLAALAARRVRALTFKGAAVAHAYYPAPHMRPHTDTDLLVSAGDLPAAEDTFVSLAYGRQRETTGRLVSYQRHFGKRDRHGVFHAFDVHVKISNRQALADRVTFEELWDRRVPIPPLGESAATVGACDALLLALVHRAGHHPGSRDLLWIYDLHLLATAITEDEREQFARLAGSRGLRLIACDGLRLARESFGTPAADRIIEALGRRRAGRGEVPVIRRAPTETDLLRLDLQALSTWRDRGRLVREHLFPAPSYMRGKYGVRSPLLLPALYAWRVVAAAPRWLRGRGGPT